MNTEQIHAEELVQKVSEVAEPLIAKYKEVYKATVAETNEVTNQIKEKVKALAEEFNNAEVKDSEALKQKLIDTIELDFVTNKVTQKEDEKVEKVQKTKEDEIRDRLRSFTRTIPMFIMANDSKDEITIDNFDLEIDDNDFLELTSITKEEFHKLRDGFDYEEDGERKTFQGVFNKYRFNASIAEFRLKKDQLANYFTAEEDIFELLPNQKTNQIFTPKKVVQMMINQLEEHDPSLFTRIDCTFIDLYMKSGMYITEIVKKLFTNTRKHYNSDDDCLKHILENQVYGLAPTPILQGITQSYIFGFDLGSKISRKNFIQHDITLEAKEGKAKEKLQELLNLTVNMKFDAVVGNPPYQESRDNTRDDAIYNYFYDLAERIASKYCLISPARFLFNAGSTDKKWNQKMLQDKHIKVLYYQQNSSVVFPNTDIKGGVAILYRNATKNFGAINTFTSFEELNAISIKVSKFTTETLDSIMSGQGIYRFTPKMHHENPQVKSILSKSHPNDVGTGVLETLDGILFFETIPDNNYEYSQILGRYKNGRVYRWIRKDYVNEPYAHFKYRVVLPKANGSGAIGEVLSTPLIGEPLIGFTQTFISIGSFDTREEAENCLKYVKSKFARTMLGILKITQDNPKDKWQKVPLQDFTNNSDIDWSKTISEIDQQLYKKYGLSAEEITFIEENVQPMD
ncbi:Eco57I restriction-modification methylase domain-containing protein [Sphingobacterium daejeonense]|uniref:Eco57I restriction-modification methylase domain-containing protein n=1 Tax=Sphingobacterium daejeonense TaxID=371142 RepID=UPI0018D84084|nr:Eco57I restriction-modification methylase domain-containing protein [Sphingobacterium daejeonense]